MKNKIFISQIVSMLFIQNSISALEIKSIVVENHLIEPSVVNVDTQTQINNITLADKLSNSVIVNQSSLPTNKSMISVRGNNFKATDYYEDGVPLYKNTHGHVDLSMYKANNSGIMLNAGGLEGEYGVSATGGELIIKSKKLKSGFSASIESTLSTNNIYANLSTSYKAEDWYFKFELNAFDQDSYKISKDFSKTDIQSSDERINSDDKTYDGSFKIGYNLTDLSTVAFKYTHLKSEYGVPIQVYDEPSNPFGASANYTRIDDKELNSYWFYYDYKEGKLSFKARAYYDEYLDVYNFYTSPDFKTLLFDSSEYQDSRLGAITSLGYKYNNIHDGLFTLRLDRNRHRQVVDNDPVKKDYENIESSLSYTHKYQYSNKLLFTSAVEYKKQELTKAYQFSVDEVDYKDNNDVGFQFRINYNLDEKQSYYMSIARKNRFASLGEIYQVFPWNTPNTDIKPETSNTIEIGSTIKNIKDSSVRIAFFYNKVKNMIVYQNSSYINADEANIKGFEFTFNNYSFDNHELELSYAYTDAKDNSSDDITHIPNSKLFLQDIMSINSKTDLIVTYLYTSKRDDIYNSTRYTLGSYSLVDAQVMHKLSNSIDLKAGVKNMFDKNYESAYGFISAGRSLFFNFKYTL